MFIYVIVCSETMKIYIGQHKGDNLQKYLQTKQSNARRNSGTRSHLFAAMRKHPKASWSIHPLMSGVENRKVLDEAEQLLIYALKSQHPDVGYNICEGGEGFTGPHTEEWRKETLERVQAYWANPESHELRSQQMKDRWAHSETRKEEQSARMRGNQYNLGRVQSPEDRAQRSASLLLYHARKRQEQDSLIHK